MPKSTQKSGTAKAVVTKNRRSGRKVTKPTRLQSELNMNTELSDLDNIDPSIGNNDNVTIQNEFVHHSIEVNNQGEVISLPSTSHDSSQPSRSEFNSLQKSVSEMKSLLLQISQKNSNDNQTNSSDNQINTRVNQPSVGSSNIILR